MATTPFLRPSYLADLDTLATSAPSSALDDLKSPPPVSPPRSLQLGAAPIVPSEATPPLPVSLQLSDTFPSPLSTQKINRAPVPLSPVPANVPTGAIGCALVRHASLTPLFAVSTPGRSLGLTIISPSQTIERKPVQQTKPLSANLFASAASAINNVAGGQPAAGSLYAKFFAEQKENCSEPLQIVIHTL